MVEKKETMVEKKVEKSLMEMQMIGCWVGLLGGETETGQQWVLVRFEGLFADILMEDQYVMVYCDASCFYLKIDNWKSA